MKGPEGTTGLPALTRERPRGAAASSPPGGVAADGSAGRRRSRPWLTITLFLLPAMLLFLALVVAPILLAMYASMFKWNGFGLLPKNFIGVDNFIRMFKDEIFLGDLGRGLILIVLSLLIQLPLSLAMALLLNQKMRGRAVYRLLFFAPYVLSEVITAVLFQMVLSPRQGLVNQLASWLGMEEIQATFLADPSTVMVWLFVVMTWKYFGFHMILYLAGRQNIPNELIEASQIDGATPWKTFRHVTLPLLGPTIRITIFLSVIGSIQLFDMVYVLTGGGPVHASETMGVTMYEFGFKRFQVGYASAISVVMFVLSLVFALGYQRWVMRRDVEGAITRMREAR